MPQLRDSNTSEIVASGPIEDLLLLSDELGDQVIWDDVPYDLAAQRVNVDFDAVRAHMEESLGLLSAAERKKEVARRKAVVKQAPQLLKVAESAQDAGVATLPHVEVG